LQLLISLLCMYRSRSLSVQGDSFGHAPGLVEI
jgi:hypothetical protein